VAQTGRVRSVDVPFGARGKYITLNHTLMAKTGRLARDKGYATSKALLGAAVLSLVHGLLYWPVAGLKFDLNMPSLGIDVHFDFGTGASHLSNSSPHWLQVQPPHRNCR
jgi:hypothetical protein